MNHVLSTCSVCVFVLYLPSYLRLHMALMTQSVWSIFKVDDYRWKSLFILHELCHTWYCLSFSGFNTHIHKDTQTNWNVPYCVVSPPDVETVEARRAALREAGGGLSSGRSTWPPTNSGPDGPQHFMAPWSPTAKPRPAYLPHDSRGAGCVRLLRLDRTHPHMSSGNCFHTELREGYIIRSLIMLDIVLLT